MAFDSERSQSSINASGLVGMVREGFKFFRWKSGGACSPSHFDGLFRQIAEDAALYEKYTGQQFSDAHVLEIGFGQHPWRLIALVSMGIDAVGIDFDMPMLSFSIPKTLAILRRNGYRRAVKTAVRSLFFDGKERRAFAQALKARGFDLRLEDKRLLIGDATAHSFGEKARFDFIYSYDVFEHVRSGDIDRLTRKVAALLSPGGVAVIAPFIFTGISGNHLPEWYPHQVRLRTLKKSEPWEHLRQNRYVANTYLNRLTLADYRRMFGTHFTVLEERVALPDLGREYLTPEVREELRDYPEEELFSNKVLFILRRKDVD